MKNILLFLILITFTASDLSGQHKLGDVEFSSFTELFNPNNRNIWHEKNNRGIFEFKTRRSDIWTKEGYSRLLIRKNEKISATFMTEEKHDQQFWNREVIEPMANQFGEPQEGTIEDPFVIGNAGQLSMKKWTYKESGRVYDIYFGDLSSFTGLIIYKNK